MSETERDWRISGVRIVYAGKLDENTAQTPGMNRAAAINRAIAGADRLWAGTVSIHPNAKTGAHHHGESRERHLRREGEGVHAMGQQT